MTRCPVLFLIFNRPRVTREVFERIRAARPPRLYVAADGPRTERAGEAEACAEVRRIGTAVDWPCEVHTLFRDENLGCHYAVEWALDWFFRHEPEGIVLEDDCLAAPGFFVYCDEMLEKFREDRTVWHINGNNFGIDRSLFGGRAYAFSSLPQVWGWAGWRDRWQRNPMNAWRLREQIRPQRWALTALARLLKRNHLDWVCEGLDAWGYQWQICVLDHQGKVVAPATNLVKNIGGGADATRTHHDPRLNIPTGDWPSADTAPPTGFNRAVINAYAAHMHLHSLKRVRCLARRNITQFLKRTARELLRRLVFRRPPPIIIASTSRSGSTLLHDAVLAAASVQWRRAPFRRLRSGVFTRLLSLTAWRLDCVRLRPGGVYKTHDLPRPRALQSGVRIVFLFGEPLVAAISTATQARQLGWAWIDQHIWHLCGEGRADELLTRDALNYERQIEAWGALPREQVLVVHYEDLWKRNDEISAFLGLPVQLPEQRPRSADEPRPPLGQINGELYDRLTRLGEALRRLP
jgi:hypothetical protein